MPSEVSELAGLSVVDSTRAARRPSVAARFGSPVIRAGPREPGSPPAEQLSHRDRENGRGVGGDRDDELQGLVPGVGRLWWGRLPVGHRDGGLDSGCRRGIAALGLLRFTVFRLVCGTASRPVPPVVLPGFAALRAPAAPPQPAQLRRSPPSPPHAPPSRQGAGGAGAALSRELPWIAGQLWRRWAEGSRG